MTVRRLSALAAVAGLLTLAACGDPDNPPVAKAPAQQRSLDDITSRMPAGWPATEAMRNPEAYPAHGSPWYPTPAPDTAEAYPAHGSPWYPTPAPETSEDPCLTRPHGVPRPC